MDPAQLEGESNEWLKNELRKMRGIKLDGAVAMIAPIIEMIKAELTRRGQTIEDEGDDGGGDGGGGDGGGGGGDAAPPIVVGQSLIFNPNAPGATPLHKSMKGVQRASGLCDADQPRFVALITRQTKEKFPSLAERVAENLSPDEVIANVAEAMCIEQRTGFTEDYRRRSDHMSRIPPATHHVVASGQVQQGKTNCKALAAAAVHTIHNCPATADQCFSIVVSTEIKWVKAITPKIKTALMAEGAPAAGASGEGSDSATGGEDDSEDEERDDLGGNSAHQSAWARFHEKKLYDEVAEQYLRAGVPAIHLDKKKALPAAKEVANQGGVVLVARSLSQLGLVMRLKKELNDERKALGQPILWPVVLADEADQDYGTGNTAGHKGSGNVDGAVAKDPKYSQWWTALIGAEHRSRWDLHRPVKSGDMPEEQHFFSSLEYPPALVMHVSATAAGSFAWIAMRTGVPHPNKPSREVVSLLDVMSFRKAAPEQRIGEEDAVPFKGLYLEQGELGKANSFLNDKAMAIVCDALKTPKALLLSCLTRGVNPHNPNVCSQQDVLAAQLVKMRVGAVTGDAFEGVALRMGALGFWTVFITGGNTAWPGQVGTKFASPDDCYGIEMLSKVHAYMYALHFALDDELAWLERRLEGMSKTVSVERRVLSDVREALTTIHGELKPNIEKLVRKGARAKRGEREVEPLIVMAIRKAQAHVRAKATHACAEACTGSGRLSADELAALQEQATAARAASHLAQKDAAEKYMKHDADRAFSIEAELLRPLVTWHETREQMARLAKDKTKMPPERLVPLAPEDDLERSTGERKAKMTASYAVPLLSMLRDMDASMAPLCRALDPEDQRELGVYFRGTNACDIPIQIHGFTMIKRSLSLISVSPTGSILGTISHVVGYSTADGAALVQMFLRFCTTATNFIRIQMGNQKVQMLIPRMAWAAIEGFTSFNQMPEWQLPRDGEGGRRALIERLKEAMRGPISEDMRNDPDLLEIVSEAVRIKKGDDGTAAATHRLKITTDAMSNAINVPDALATLCDNHPSALFPGTSGRDCGQLFCRANKVKRRREGQGDLPAAPELAKPPAKKRKESPGAALFQGWIKERLNTLGAIEQPGTLSVRWANAVGHGALWDALCAEYQDKLSDPEVLQQLDTTHVRTLTSRLPTDVRIVCADGKVVSGQHRQGGPGKTLDRMASRGEIALLMPSDPGNPTAKLSKKMRVKVYALYRPRHQPGAIPAGFDDEDGRIVEDDETHGTQADRDSEAEDSTSEAEFTDSDDYHASGDDSSS